MKKGEADKSLGHRISELRVARRWTQAQMAERIGVDTETFGRFERGATEPSIRRLRIIAKTLRVPVGDLFSEGTDAGIDDAELRAAVVWLSELMPKDREFALKLVRNLCDYLRKK